MSAPMVRLVAVSKWYGEVLGLDRVSLDVGPGITSLVGPNGSGKSTLMNLVTGLLHPSKGHVEVLGLSTARPDLPARRVGYCTQHDTFPAGFTGEQLLVGLLRTRVTARRAQALAAEAFERVGLGDARRRRIAGYSKGMRQRLKLALALAHGPEVVVLDEPLDGLDPLGRTEATALFRHLADEGRAVLLSSHVLHEVDALSDSVVMLHHGTVVAEGAIRDVRSEILDRPLQVAVTCDAPERLAARAFEAGRAAAARVDGRRVVIDTFDVDGLARLIGSLAADRQLDVEAIELADENMQAVYDYLIRGDEGST